MLRRKNAEGTYEKQFSQNTLHPFEVHNSMSSDIFTGLYNHHYNLKHFCYPEKKPQTSSSQSPPLSILLPK